MMNVPVLRIARTDHVDYSQTYYENSINMIISLHMVDITNFIKSNIIKYK